MKNAILIVCICAFALGFAGVAAAQAPAKVAGAWDLSMQGGQGGGAAQTLTIQQDGAKITGTLKGGRGESPLEGTVDGNKITFTVKRQTPNGEVSQEYTGTLADGTITGTVKMGQNDRTWTATMAKQ